MSRKESDDIILITIIFTVAAGIIMAVFYVISYIFKAIILAIKWIVKYLTKKKNTNSVNFIKAKNELVKEEINTKTNVETELNIVNTQNVVINEKYGDIKNLITEKIGKENCKFLTIYEDPSSELKQRENNFLKNKVSSYKKLSDAEIHEIVTSFNYDNFTIYTEAKKSGSKTKLFYLNNSNKPCTTEDIAVDFYKTQGYKAFKAEVNFWQMVFCLCFFEEIYCRYWNLHNDIPFDYFQNDFYASREDLFKNKILEIQNSKNLKEFILNQKCKYGDFNSRLLYPHGTKVSPHLFEKKEILSFFDVISINDFLKIMQYYAQNPAINRAGIPDLVTYNQEKYKLVEVKRLKEKIRDTQENWLSFLKMNKIPFEIIRIKSKN